MPDTRYHRQMLLPAIGEAGQARLARARVLLVGCGALGTIIAELLTRAGVGLLRIADRDWVELTNLQRQVLFDEADAVNQTPKAIAAAQRLARINSGITIEPHVVDVHAGNIEELAGVSEDGPAAGGRVDLIVDGTDNAQTRYLVNDVSIKHGVTWVYGACVGTEGRVMTIEPGAQPAGACLRCLFPQPPSPGELATCDTAGVFGPAACLVGSLQAAAALRLLAGGEPGVPPQLVRLDAWSGAFRSSSTLDARRPDCPTCGKRHFTFLDAGDRGATTSLCGRNAVQVRPAERCQVDLDRLATKLEAAGRIDRTPYLVRCDLSEAPGIKMTAFADGRLIVQGTSDLDRARSLYARFVGT